ncbi:Serine-threonine/tyrosine-protein kinase, partial [Theobroma cacao]
MVKQICQSSGIEGLDMCVKYDINGVILMLKYSGYMSLEYAMQGQFLEKSDVFSFGVILLEMVSRRKNTSFYDNQHSFSLLGYAWKLWKEDNIVGLVDMEAYDPSYDEKEILRCIHVGLICVQEFAKDRPVMSRV